MNRADGMRTLFQYACEQKINEFDVQMEELEHPLPLQEMGEAYLMRAQVKLLSSDITMLEDLERAEAAEANPQYPCLVEKWPVETPNRFIVFPTAPAALAAFTAALPKASDVLGGRYGASGIAMVRQVQSAICYFTCEFDKAIALEQGNADSESPTSKILSQYILFRSHLAIGQARNAEDAMLEAIRISKTHTDCLPSYQAFRQWANLTTGWCGENPRFTYGPFGEDKPFFEDREEAIREGIEEPLSSEKPFVEFAQRHIEKPYTLRDYYVDLYRVMYLFREGDTEHAEARFMPLYQVALNSGVTAPIVEYGKQVVPLLQHIKGCGAACAPEWLDKLIVLAGQYEQNLDKYRA